MCKICCVSACFDGELCGHEMPHVIPSKPKAKLTANEIICKGYEFDLAINRQLLDHAEKMLKLNEDNAAMYKDNGLCEMPKYIVRDWESDVVYKKKRIEQLEKEFACFKSQLTVKNDDCLSDISKASGVKFQKTE